MMQTLLQDLRYGVRMLLKKPGFTLIAVITLALGIGANTAIFSVVNAVLLRPLPYSEPVRLVWLWGNLRGGNSTASINPLDFLDYRGQNRTFEHLAAFFSGARDVVLTGSGEPERLRGSVVTANFFDVFGVKPALGRSFIPEEEEVGRNQVVVLSYGLWQRRFGGDPSIIGRTITLEDYSFNVIGVMPAGFKPPVTTDLWEPAPLLAMTNNRKGHFMRAIGRLKPGVTIGQAQADLDVIARRLGEQFPDTNANKNLRLVPLQEQMIGNIGQSLWMLFGTAGFVLLIACANVANLLLARTATRTREIAVRSAIGASRWRVARQLLTESLLLSLCGGALGVLTAVWMLDLLVSISAGNIPPWAQVGIDTRVLGFTLLATILTGLLFGLAPALQASKPNLIETLKEGGHSVVGGARGNRIRSLWVVSEVALAVVVLIGAGLLIRSLMRLQQVDPGFDAKNVLALRLNLSPARYQQPAPAIAFSEQLRQRLAALPGVQAVGTISELPLSGQRNDYGFRVEGRPRDPNRRMGADWRRVDHGYFRAMNIPLLRGRGFTEQEARAGSGVAIISDILAQRFFPNEDPVGKRLLFDFGQEMPFEIIGVVGDVHHRALHIGVYQTIYFPSLRLRDSNLVIRAAGAPANLAAEVRRAVQEIDKNLPVSAIRPMEELLINSMGRQRLNTFLLSAFAALALFLAVIGVYGVMSYSVTQQTHEIGVRLALGARMRDVLVLVLRQGMRLALLGVVIGLLSALALARLVMVRSLLFEVNPTDPATFAAIAVLLTAVMLLACWIPARRAAKVDPMVALRCE
jgi:putative ABC transport system permease protein